MAEEDDKSSFTEVMMILTVSIPTLGTMISAPLVGTGLASLAILDSILVLINGR